MNDQRKTKKALIQELNALEFSEDIINTVREPLIVLDHYLRVGTASRSLVVFALDEPRYALLLSAVVRVVHAVEISPLPNAPAIIQGAINVQGRIIPVVNIRERLQLPAREMNGNDHFIIAQTKRRSVALVTDYVAGIRELADDQAGTAGQSLPFVEYLHGVVKIEDNLILIYDLDTFLSLQEEQMLDNAISGGTKL
jgi:purine-binding chemotaxis protein CheW